MDSKGAAIHILKLVSEGHQHITHPASMIYEDGMWLPLGEKWWHVQKSHQEWWTPEIYSWEHRRRRRRRDFCVHQIDWSARKPVFDPLSLKSLLKCCWKHGSLVMTLSWPFSVVDITSVLSVWTSSCVPFLFLWTLILKRSYCTFCVKCLRRNW